ncbi:MAG: APC family permease, partial [Chitinophagaceae bacterium]
LATSDKPLAESAQAFMGPWGGVLIIAGAFISIAGTLNVLLLSGSRLPYALSQEGQFPRLFAHVHAKYATPVASLFLFTVLVIAASLAWSFMGALTIAVIIRLLMYMAVCAALLKLRRQKGQETFYKVPFGRVLALAGIAISMYLLTKTEWQELRDFLLVTGAGIAVYFIQKGIATFTKQ